MTDSHPMLPGMASPAPAQTPLEVAATSVLAGLREKDLLKPEHALLAQMVLDLARAMGLSAEKGRAAGVALASRELREAIALLPKSGGDALDRLILELQTDAVHE